MRGYRGAARVPERRTANDEVAAVDFQAINTPSDLKSQGQS